MKQQNSSPLQCRQILFLTLVALLLSSCLVEGTDTGNPGLADPSLSNEGDSSEPIDYFAIKICQTIDDCHPTAPDNCFQLMLTQNNIDTELGLEVDEYETFAIIRTEAREGRLTVNSEAFDLCIDDIEALTCESSEVANAYNPSLSNSLEGVAEMIPSSCQNFFEE